MAASIQTDVAPNLAQLPREGKAAVDGFKVVDFTFSTSYPNTGGTIGEPISVPSGFTTIDFVVVSRKTLTNHTFVYDYTNNKLRAVVGSTGSEVANTTDLSAITVRLLIFGS